MFMCIFEALNKTKNNMGYGDRLSIIADEIRRSKDDSLKMKFINEYIRYNEREQSIVHSMDDFEEFCEEEIGSYGDVVEACRYNGFTTSDYFFRYDGSEFYSGDAPEDVYDDDDDWENATQWWIEEEGMEFLNKFNLNMGSIRESFVDYCDDTTIEIVEATLTDEDILTRDWDELEAELPTIDDEDEE